MNDGLVALERLTKIHNHNDFKECYKIIEKELKEHEQHKVIEQELGIDFITLIKALKEPVYVIINNKIVETQCGHIGEECKVIDFEVDGKDYKNLYDIETYCVLVKDYGKTWALTREELEK